MINPEKFQYLSPGERDAALRELSELDREEQANTRLVDIRKIAHIFSPMDDLLSENLPRQQCPAGVILRVLPHKQRDHQRSVNPQVLDHNDNVYRERQPNGQVLIVNTVPVRDFLPGILSQYGSAGAVLLKALNGLDLETWVAMNFNGRLFDAEFFESRFAGERRLESGDEYRECFEKARTTVKIKSGEHALIFNNTIKEMQVAVDRAEKHAEAHISRRNGEIQQARQGQVSGVPYYTAQDRRYLKFARLRGIDDYLRIPTQKELIAQTTAAQAGQQEQLAQQIAAGVSAGVSAAIKELVPVLTPAAVSAPSVAE